MTWIARAATAAAGTAVVVIGTAGVASAVPSVDPEVTVRCEGQIATIVGTDVRERLVGTPGPDVIKALGGNDTIRGKGGDDVICAGKDDDILYGGRGDDRILGGGNRPVKYWGDRFYDGQGDDYMNGGNDSGYDYLYYDKAENGITVDRPAGTVTGEFSGLDTIELIGAITGSAYDDVMIDDESEGYFEGAAGDDVIDVGGGDDVAFGGVGNDTVSAGGGDDWITGSDGDDLLDGGAGTDDGDGDAGTDTCIDIERPTGCELGPRLEAGAPHPDDASAAVRRFSRSGGETA